MGKISISSTRKYSSSEEVRLNIDPDFIKEAILEKIKKEKSIVIKPEELIFETDYSYETDEWGANQHIETKLNGAYVVLEDMIIEDDTVKFKTNS